MRAAGLAAWMRSTMSAAALVAGAVRDGDDLPHVDWLVATKHLLQDVAHTGALVVFIGAPDIRDDVLLVRVVNPSERALL